MTSSLSGVTSSVGGWWDIEQAVVSGTVNQVADHFRHRVQNIQFNNITELNSLFYTCKVNKNEFNYSTNPTYLSASAIIVRDSDRNATTTAKEKEKTTPITFITTVGLYSLDNELMAVSKLEMPVKKDKNTEHAFKIRFDF